MAVAISEVAELATTTNTTTYALGTFTPPADSILVTCVTCAGADGSTVPTLTDSEGEWDWEHSDFTESSTKGTHILWRKTAGSPVEITPTVDGGADAYTGCLAVIYAVTPDTMPSGNPIRQVVASLEQTAADPTVTFASNLLTGNGYLFFSLNGINPYAMTSAPTGWTATVDTGHSAPGLGFWAAFRAGGETGTTITATRASTFHSTWGVEVWNEEPPVATHLHRLALMGCGG